MEHDPGSGPRTPPHYFSPDPGTPHRPRRLSVRLRGRDVEVGTDAGVFSAGRLDLGTRVLLREAPDPPVTGDLLDLGCGWGPLALSMAMAAPRARVWAVDVHPRAEELTAGNAAEQGLHGVRACLPEQVPEEISFAAIWSNPPIRVGKADLHALLLRWLPRLTSGAEAHLVVQRTLGADSLQAWLGPALGAGFSVRRAGSAKGYRVIRIQRGGGTELMD